MLAGVEDHVFAANSTYTDPLSAIEFFKKTGVDALAISYGTMHGASKGKNVKLRREIPIAIKECMNHEGIQGAWCPTAPPPCPATSWTRSTPWAAASRTPTASPRRS